MQRQITIHNLIKKSMILGASVLLIVLLSLLYTEKAVCYAATELYAAGIPKEYPLEYYDKKSNSYQGVLPELLQTAAKNAGFALTYVNPSNKDKRLELSKNLQADVVCAMNLTEEELQQAGLSRGKELLFYMEGEEKISISFAYTESISKESREKLEQELQKMDKNRLLDLQMKHVKAGYEQNPLFVAFQRIILVVLISVAAILLVLPFRVKKRKKQIENITYIDDETGQYNYAKWKQKYKECVSGENCSHYAVLYLYAGIEGISHIYGYMEASEAVRIISNVCGLLVDKETEGVARFNEFYFIFFVRYSSEDNLKERIRVIHQAIQKEFKEQKKKYFLDLHTGIYQLTTTETDLNKVLQYSKVALEYAKSHYLSCAAYNETVERETISGYVMEHEAIHGLMQEEFKMYLQPMQEVKTEKICGAEALVRWHNPVRGLLKPGEFLDVMKRKKLTGIMNMEIYRQGCGFLKAEKEKGHHTSILFNFSVENFGDGKFAEDLYEIAQQYGIDTKQIIVQLNQLVEISESELFMSTIKKLREYQFDVCLAGLELDKVFLEYLKCGVNYLKIRRELVQNSGSPKGKKLLKSVVKLCHDLELKTICVGVEKEEQMKILQELECEMAIGFYYYYPVSQEVFSGLLETEC